MKKNIKGDKLRIEDIRKFLKTYSYKKFKARFLENVTDREDGKLSPILKVQY